MGSEMCIRDRESGDAQQIVSAPQTEYTKALMSAAFDLEATDSPDIVAD